LATTLSVNHPPLARRLCAALVAIAAAMLALIAYEPTPCAQGTSASSEPARPKRIGIYTEGRDADALRSEIASVVPKDVAVVDAATYRHALFNAQIYGQMGPRLGSPNPKVEAALENQVAKANRFAQTDGSIVARVRGVSAKGRDVYLVIVGTDGKAEPHELVVPAGAEGAAALRSALASYLKLDVPEATARSEPSPAAEEPSPAELPPPDAPAPKRPPKRAPKLAPSDDPFRDEAARRADETAKAALRRPLIGGLAVAFEVAGRAFEYTGAASSNLRPYSALGQSAFEVEGDVYPFTTSAVPVLRDIGVFAEIDRTFGFDTTAQGATIGGSWTHLLAGVAARVRFGTQAPVLTLSGGFGWVNAVFDDAGRLNEQVPTVTYLFVRPGIDLAFRSGPVLLHFGGGYAAVFEASGVSDRFKHSIVRGFDVRGGVNVRLWGWPERAMNPTAFGLEGRFAAFYSRYFYDITAQPQDEYIAEGAYDELYGLTLGPAIVF